MQGFLVILLAFSFAGVVLSDDFCKEFIKKYKSAKKINDDRKKRNDNLQGSGFLASEGDVGFGYKSYQSCNKSCTKRWYNNDKADSIITAARLFADADASSISTLEKYGVCLGFKPSPIRGRKKYRNINGHGNSLHEPFLGTSGAPFGRFGPKNFFDGVRTSRRSENGDFLPPARRIVSNVLLKADKAELSCNVPNDLLNFFFLTIAKDIAQQVPQVAADGCSEIRCCNKGNKALLTKNFLHSSCLPVTIDPHDEFYKEHKVKCLNFVRSQYSTLPSKLKFGEIMNKATALLDLSSVYGVEEDETNAIRSFDKGCLRMSADNLLPVDADNKFGKASERMLTNPTTTIVPSLFARNHNKIALGLSAMNVNWTDEKVFQETRRINIGIFQSVIYEDRFSDAISSSDIDVCSYDKDIDSSTSIEFASAVYRFTLGFANSNIKFVDKDKHETDILMSDAFGKVDIAGEKFDDLLRGSLSQNINTGQPSEEFLNKFAKNDDGVGMDLFTANIIRGRDHGLGTFLQVREVCGLRSDYASFADLSDILPESSIQYLSSTYATVNDIDLIVGGALETYNDPGHVFGETFRCIVNDQLKRSAFGDAYFFSARNGKYPFRPRQVDAIKRYSFKQLICHNSGLTAVPGSWFRVASHFNREVLCSSLPKFDLAHWKE